MPPLLEVHDLSKWYPITGGFFRRHIGYAKALTGASFSLSEGSILGVIGESGSGKSTLARTLLRLTEPTTGKVYFAGKDFTSLNKKQLKCRRLPEGAPRLGKFPLLGFAASMAPRKDGVRSSQPNEGR